MNQAEINVRAQALADELAAVSRAMKFLYGMPEGELVFGYLLRRCGAIGTTVPDGYGTNQTFFNEGRRSIGDEMISLIVHAPDRFKLPALKLMAGQAEGKDL